MIVFGLFPGVEVRPSDGHPVYRNPIGKHRWRAVGEGWPVLQSSPLCPASTHLCLHQRARPLPCLLCTGERYVLTPTFNHQFALFLYFSGGPMPPPPYRVRLRSNYHHLSKCCGKHWTIGFMISH